MRSLRHIWAEHGGSTVMMFGLAAVPLLVLAGGAVDFAHRANVKARVQSAVDTAALAAARTIQSGGPVQGSELDALQGRAETSAADIFRASLTDLFGVSNAEPVIQLTADGVTIAADIDVETSFLGIIGIDTLGADGMAEVNIPDALVVEIALVLDYSKSMEENDKYIRMTEAAQSFIGKIADDRAGSSKIGIVPFSEYVRATVLGADIRGVRNKRVGEAISACLMNRDYPYSASVDQPTSAITGSRWPQADSDSKKCKQYASGGLAMQDLTDNFSGLSAALGDMRPVGLTNLALGAEMGWHLLDPGAPFETARSYEDGSVRKVMILLTDGVQTVEAMGPGGAVSTQAADATTAALCENAAAAGIRIFSIAYDIEDDGVRSLLSGCAAGTNGYYEADSDAEIDAVFGDIYDQLAETVWISR